MGDARGEKVAQLVAAFLTGVIVCLVGTAILNIVFPSSKTPEIVTVEVTRISERIITVTPTDTPAFTPTPSYTPTITLIPTITPTPTATLDPTAEASATLWAKLTSPKEDGFYLVGVDIAPGTWRSQGESSNCYWARYDKNLELLGNHFGLAGGVVKIYSTDFEFESEHCGTWAYLGP